MALFNWSMASRAMFRGQVTMWSWFTHFTGQNTFSDIPRASVASRCALLMTSLLTCHSLLLYQGCLLSELIRPSTFRPPFDSFQDVVRLVQQKQARIDFVARGTPFEQSQSDESLQLMAALDDNPPLYSLEDGNVDDSSKLIIKYGSATMSLLNFDRHTCDETLIETDGSAIIAFPLSWRMNATLKQCLNEAIGRNIDGIAAIFSRKMDVGHRDYQTCRRERFAEQTPDVADGIRMIRLSGNFVVWLAGLAIAGAVFLVEMMRRGGGGSRLAMPGRRYNGWRRKFVLAEMW